jgi:hypothetical protein
MLARRQLIYIPGLSPDTVKWRGGQLHAAAVHDVACGGLGFLFYFLKWWDVPVPVRGTLIWGTRTLHVPYVSRERQKKFSFFSKRKKFFPP